MEFRSCKIDGPLEIIARNIEDDRDYFAEIFRFSTLSERTLNVQFVQDNQSLSASQGTIRGVHFQAHPAVQGKLVRCLAGDLIDVAVDLRRGSPSKSDYASYLRAVATEAI